MATSRLDQLLGPGRIAVCDGAMGTQLYGKGVFINRSFDELNLSSPDLVRSVHEDYIEAGADVIETNSFAANRYKLAPHGLEGMVAQINAEAARIARSAVGDGPTLVAGSIGPLGVRIEPWGAVSVEEARAAFREQAGALLEGGVDLLILETFYHLPELREAVLAIRELSDSVPVVAQVTVTEEGSTPEGIEPAAFARTISEWDVDAVGVNCGVGPVATLDALEEMGAATELPLSAMPNAGRPRMVHGRNIYMSSPEYMASYARRFIKAGVRLVGGCCGTESQHIRAIREAVIAVRPEARPVAVTADEVAKAGGQPLPLAEKSLLGRRLAGGEFALCVQVRPPRGHDVEASLRAVRELKAGGVEILTLPEGRGGARMPPIAMAAICQREADVETLVGYACRSRTLLRMQSELLGAYALGLRNLLLVTGDPPTLGDFPDTRAGLEVDSIGLTNMVGRLNLGLDVGGSPIGGPTSFLIGVHFDPFAIDTEEETRRCEWKVDAGAEVAMLPPILDAEAFDRFLGRTEHCRIPLIATVPLLTSYRAAETIRRRTGQTDVPDEVLGRLRRAEREGKEDEVGLAVTLETVETLRPKVQGLQVVTPEEMPAAEMLKVVEAIRARI